MSEAGPGDNCQPVVWRLFVIQRLITGNIDKFRLNITQ